MATFRKRGNRWQAQVRLRGAAPQSKSFETRAAAQRWARGLERDIDEGRARKGKAVTGTLADLIDRYEREVGEVKAIGRTKASSLGLLRQGLGHVRARDLDAERIIAFARARRKAGAGPVTIGIDISYLGTILRTARALWRLGISDEPVREAREALKMVGLVGRSGERERRPTPAEIAALQAHWRANPRQGIPMWDIVEFAVATAMRQEEICRIRWADLLEGERTVVIRDRKDPREKAGNDETVPLLDVTGYDALGIIRRQPRTGSAEIFPYKPYSVSTAFTRACQALGIEDLRFHDLRHEGTSRLFEAGLAVQQVALVTGHKDWRTLRRYTQLRAADLTAAFPSRRSADSPVETPPDRAPSAPPG